MKKIVFALILGSLFAACNSNSGPVGLSVSGKITCMSGNGLAGVAVKLQVIGGAAFSTTTNSSGIYTFADVPADQLLSITPTKTGSYYDGVTTDDAGFANTASNDWSNITPLQYLAMPKTSSGLSTGVSPDNALMKKLVSGEPLGTISTPVWQFVQPGITMAEAQNSPVNFLKVAALSADLTGADFVGVKFGDLNGSWCQ